MSDEPEEPLPIPRHTVWLRRARRFLLGLAILVIVGVVALDTPRGHQFVAGQIANLRPQSGLRITVNEIGGSIWRKAVLRDVELYDPEGKFAHLPEVELDWRPFNWFLHGLDIREAASRGGTLQRIPRFQPGDPDAPILPDFDIRIDRLQVTDLTIGPDILGEPRKLGIVGRADIDDERLLVKVDADAGGGDKLHALLDAFPEGDRFDIKLDYQAPKGGLQSSLTGLDMPVRARINGKGSWQSWDGALLVELEKSRFAAFKLSNRAGRYALLGQLRPSILLAGNAKRAVGEVVNVRGEATFQDRVLDARLGIAAAKFKVGLVGGTDLAESRFDNVHVYGELTDPGFLGSDVSLDGIRLRARLDGPFSRTGATFGLKADALRTQDVKANAVAISGSAGKRGNRWNLPFELAVGQIRTGQPDTDRRLANIRATGELAIEGLLLSIDDLKIELEGISAKLAARSDLSRNTHEISGDVSARNFPVDGLGRTDANAAVKFVYRGSDWSLKAGVVGQMSRFDSATLASLVGDKAKFSGDLTLESGKPMLIERASLDASKLNLELSGRRMSDGSIDLAGNGSHVAYGPFSGSAKLGGERLKGELLLENPVPAADIENVNLELEQSENGWDIELAGNSMLGAFSGALELVLPSQAPARLTIGRLEIWKTKVDGEMEISDAGLLGKLALAGGGLDGSLVLAPQADGQGFEAKIQARDAAFGGERRISIGRGRIEAKGHFADNHNSFEGSLNARRIEFGNTNFRRLTAKANIADGSGTASGSISGRRGSRFNLQFSSEVSPGRIATLAQGEFGDFAVSMPRRAILLHDEKGWRLEQTQVNFGEGRAVVSAQTGLEGTTADLAVSKVPLSLIDALGGNYALQGSASGLINYRQDRFGVPTASARLLIEGLSRSGLLLASRPIDSALVVDLTKTRLEARATLKEGGKERGRLQALVTELPDKDGLIERLSTGKLSARLNYDGPSDALWRILAIEEFDLTGPVRIGADITGSIADPVINGSISGNGMRLSSAMIGAEVKDIELKGHFTGPRLKLSAIRGKIGRNGGVSGAGSVDLSDLSTQGPGIDLNLSAKNALVLNRPHMSASVTGPIRIVSNGNGGTIAGRLKIVKASWQLGRADAVYEIPEIPTREINGKAGQSEAGPVARNWRYLIDAQANDRIDVRGLGLDSEWSANLRLRGTTSAPTIFGTADLIRGNYEFAGKRFDLTRGRITFSGESPPNPLLDITAETAESGLTARISIKGSAARPQITLSSTPSLPEEELLSRILFGSSVTDISPAEGLQLGAALASLRGGGGLDPINKLRGAIGLDRLRIVNADVATGRETGILAGKYISRRLYAEVISDGQGYSASQLEFRLTNWLSLLATISSIGRESIGLRVQKDY